MHVDAQKELKKLFEHLVENDNQVIYTTQASDDTVTYSYYKQGAKLYFLIYEKNSTTLTSLELGKKVTEAFEVKDVTTVLFSEKNAQEIDANLELADHYVYYTLAADKESEHKEGVRVYQVRPDGTKKHLMSEGEEITLLSIRGGKLVYSDADNFVYAETITDNKNLSPDIASNVIMANKYDNFVIIEETAGKLSTIVYDNTTLRKLTYENGVVATADEKVQLGKFVIGANDYIDIKITISLI